MCYKENNLPMKVLIICAPDAFANGLYPKEAAKYLGTKGCEVEIYPTTHLSRKGQVGLEAVLPGLHPRQLALYFMEAVHVLADRLGGTFQRAALSATFRRVIKLRGAILRAKLADSSYDLIICEHNLDNAFVEGDRIAPTQVLHLPSPFAEELFFGDKISARAFKKFKTYDAELYAKADHVGFHWHTYTKYVKRTKYDGSNLDINLPFGVEPQDKRAKFQGPPRIVFLGLLSGYWVNVPLLKRLCELYPHIDIYGGPRLTELGDNYKGYAPTTDVLEEYQFGLVTVSDDPLRRNSFSSKQLRYYSYGLPVLSPNWRHDSVLDEAALLYDEKSFVDLVNSYSDEEKWRELSDKALKIAQQYDWEEVLRPLDALIDPARLRDDRLQASSSPTTPGLAADNPLISRREVGRSSVSGVLWENASAGSRPVRGASFGVRDSKWNPQQQAAWGWSEDSGRGRAVSSGHYCCRTYHRYRKEQSQRGHHSAPRYSCLSDHERDWGSRRRQDPSSRF
jgi:hypothetical protein